MKVTRTVMDCFWGSIRSFSLKVEQFLCLKKSDKNQMIWGEKQERIKKMQFYFTGMCVLLCEGCAIFLVDWRVELYNCESGVSWGFSFLFIYLFFVLCVLVQYMCAKLSSNVVNFEWKDWAEGNPETKHLKRWCEQGGYESSWQRSTNTHVRITNAPTQKSLNPM